MDLKKPLPVQTVSVRFVNGVPRFSTSLPPGIIVTVIDTGNVLRGRVHSDQGARPDAVFGFEGLTFGSTMISWSDLDAALKEAGFPTIEMTACFSEVQKED